jgi:hypothetical protein
MTVLFPSTGVRAASAPRSRTARAPRTQSAASRATALTSAAEPATCTSTATTAVRSMLAAPADLSLGAVVVDLAAALGGHARSTSRPCPGRSRTGWRERPGRPGHHRLCNRSGCNPRPLDSIGRLEIKVWIRCKVRSSPGQRPAYPVKVWVGYKVRSSAGQRPAYPVKVWVRFKVRRPPEQRPAYPGRAWGIEVPAADGCRRGLRRGRSSNFRGSRWGAQPCHRPPPRHLSWF